MSPKVQIRNMLPDEVESFTQLKIIEDAEQKLKATWPSEAARVKVWRHEARVLIRVSFENARSMSSAVTLIGMFLNIELAPGIS